MFFQLLPRCGQPHKQQQAVSPVAPRGGGPLPAASDVEAVAGAIEAAGMSVPALLALQVGSPLSWIGGQLLWMLQPFAEGLGIGSRKSPLSVSGLAQLLERDGGVSSLVERLDAGAGNAGARGGGK